MYKEWWIPFLKTKYSLLLKVFTGQEKSIEMPKAKAFHICPIRITANISAFQAEDVGSIPT